MHGSRSLPRALALLALVSATSCLAAAPSIPDAAPTGPVDATSSRDATRRADREAAPGDARDATLPDTFVRLPDAVSSDALTEDALLGDAPPGGGDGSECHAPLTLCAGECIDEQTDPNDCGGCGVLCAGACVSARCLVTLASDQDAPAGIAVSDGYVFWTNQGSSVIANGAVMAITVDGVTDGGAAALLAAGQGSPYGVAVLGPDVYWTTEVGGMVMSTVVTDAGAASDAARPLAAGQRFPVGVALGEREVYWTNAGTGDAGGSVMGLALSRPGAADASAPTRLAWHQDLPTSIAVAADAVLWASRDGVMSLPLVDGGAAGVLVAARPTSIATDAASVYWTNLGTAANQYADGAVLRAPVSGGHVTTLATGQFVGAAIAVDAASVYWTTQATPSGGGNIVKVALEGGATTTLVTGQSPVGGLALDATSVYWTSAAQGGSVLKLTPK